MYDLIKGSSGFELFNKLRGLHVSLATQLGLIEEWMRTEIRRNIPSLMEEVVDHEREVMLDNGTEHVLRHLRIITKEESQASDEDEDDSGESGMVH